MTMASINKVGVICPQCSGVKSVINANKAIEETCDLCKGHGWIPFMDHISDALRWLTEQCHRTAKDHGWWEGDKDYIHNVPEKLALMHSEISEALEEYRKGIPLNSLYSNNEKPEGFTVELADLFIRVFDFLGYFELTEQFITAMLLKMEYNKSREYRHGGKKA